MKTLEEHGAMAYTTIVSASAADPARMPLTRTTPGPRQLSAAASFPRDAASHLRQLDSRRSDDFAPLRHFRGNDSGELVRRIANRLGLRRVGSTDRI